MKDAQTFVIALGLAGFVGFEIFYQASQRVEPVDVPPARSAPVFEAATPVAQELVEVQKTPSLSAAEAGEEQSEALDLVLAPRLDLQNGSLPWEGRVEAITHSTTLAEVAKGRELLRNLVSLPEEGLEFATQQAVDRLPDKDYAAALGLLINPQTHGRVLAVLFADLLKRPDEITLPALLSIARNTSHPFASQARDNLGLLVGKDFESNWNQWDGEIRRLLKESP